MPAHTTIEILKAYVLYQNVSPSSERGGEGRHVWGSEIRPGGSQASQGKNSSWGCEKIFPDRFRFRKIRHPVDVCILVQERVPEGGVPLDALLDANLFP